MATTVFDKPIGTEIGQLSSLTTSSKTNIVSAINSLNSKIANMFDYTYDEYVSDANSGIVSISARTGYRIVMAYPIGYYTERLQLASNGSSYFVLTSFNGTVQYNKVIGVGILWIKTT